MFGEFLKNYPLPSGWTLQETFSDPFCLGDLVVDRVGLAAQRQDGVLIAGSATGQSAPLRAVSELLERILVKEFTEEVHSELTLFDFTGHHRGAVAKESLFLNASEPAVFQYAKSNGVALFPDLQGACNRAALELIERDRILRSWYGGEQPVELSSSVLKDWFAFSALSKIYHVRVFLFEDYRDASGAQVVGVFCFPRSPEHVFSFGFGAGATVQTACSHAQEECLQRISFLWGESFDSCPTFSPTPMYHQEIFSTPEGMRRIQRWLRGEHEATLVLGRLEFHWSVANDEVLFVELTPAHLKEKLHLVKAVSPQRLPLIFGKGYQDFFPDVADELRIHPIA